MDRQEAIAFCELVRKQSASIARHLTFGRTEEALSEVLSLTTTAHKKKQELSGELLPAVLPDEWDLSQLATTEGDSRPEG